MWDNSMSGEIQQSMRKVEARKQTVETAPIKEQGWSHIRTETVEHGPEGEIPYSSVERTRGMYENWENRRHRPRFLLLTREYEERRQGRVVLHAAHDVITGNWVTWCGRIVNSGTVWGKIFVPRGKLSYWSKGNVWDIWFREILMSLPSIVWKTF